MATVTLTGKVLLPDGSVPTGSLEFTLAAKVEDASGNVCVPIAAVATIGALGAVSVTLEATQQYDVVAVLTGARPGRYSLGRWLAPGATSFTNPSLCDGWRNTLTAPDNNLRLVANFASGLLTKTPKRAVGDVWTFTGGATWGANGLVIDGVRTCSIPSLDNFSLTIGTLALKIVPTWAGNDGVQHNLVDSTAASNSRLALVKTAANALDWSIYDSAGDVKTKSMAVTDGNLPAATAARIGVRWNAGTLKLRLNVTDAANDAGAGTGVLSNLPTPLWVGSRYDGTLQLEGECAAIRIWAAELTDDQLTAALAAL